MSEEQSPQGDAASTLRTLAEHLRLFVEYAPAAIAMVDTDMQYMAVSRRWLSDYGFDVGQVQNRSHYDLFPEIPEHWKAVHRRCLAGEAESNDGELFVRADGTHQWVRWAIQPWRTASGAVGGLVIFSEDITARKEAEAALKRAEDALRQQRDALTAYTQELQRRANQLRQLASDLTLAEQQARETLAKTLHDHLQQLLFSATLKLDRLSKTDADRPSADTRLLERARHDLSEAVAATRSLAVELYPPVLHENSLSAALSWLKEWMKDRYGVVVDLIADPHATPLDKDVRTLLFESVRELLFNAVKHAKIDRIAVEAILTSGDEIRITVSDAGAGFDPAVVFARQAAHRGGLGLVTIRERLALLGGRLDVDSRPGRGSRFTLTLARTPAR